MSNALGCEFCDIVRYDEPAQIVMKSDEVVAFFPLAPATLGHTLLIPTAHVPDIWALDPTQAAALSIASLRLARAIKSALDPDGLNVIQSNGEAATQSVMHVHVHLVPRWYGDRMGPIWPKESSVSESQESEALQAIREAAVFRNE